MTEGSHVFLEQRVVRGVVQVDVEVVREEKLHKAERILGTGTLPHPGLSAVIERLHVLTRHVGAALREYFLRRDRRWHVPVWAKHHRLHRVGKNGSRLVLILLADDDFHLQNFLASVKRLELERRNVDEDVARSECARQPAIALHVGRNFGETIGRGNVHRLDGLSAERAIDVDRMSLLKDSDGAGEVAIVDTGTGSGRAGACRIRRRTGGGHRNSLGRQPVADGGDHSGIRRAAGFHVPGYRWNWLPAALRNDTAPFLQRFAETGVVLFLRTQRRQRLVEMLVPKISGQRAVDVLLLGVDVPRLLYRAWIDLAGHQIFAKCDVGGGEHDVSGGELIGGGSFRFLERRDCLGQLADRIVVHPHAVTIGGKNGVGEGLGSGLVQAVGRKPECILAVGFVQGFGVSPLLVIDSGGAGSRELRLQLRFDFGGGYALDGREFFGRPGLRIFRVSRACRLAHLAPAGHCDCQQERPYEARRTRVRLTRD